VDDAWFVLSGYINSQNTYGGTKYLYVIQQIPLHAQ